MGWTLLGSTEARQIHTERSGLKLPDNTVQLNTVYYLMYGAPETIGTVGTGTSRAPGSF